MSIRKLLHHEILLERKTNEEAISCERHPVSVLLHNVRSLYNVGSVFRTCDSALADSLVLTGFTPAPPRKEILKTALGSVDSVPWNYEKDIFKAIKDEKAKGKKVIAVELTEDKRMYDSLQLEEYPMTLVMGNELSGLEDEVLAECDSAIEIPMYGVKHSLNVSVATGIALFEAIKIYRMLKNK